MDKLLGRKLLWKAPMIVDIMPTWMLACQLTATQRNDDIEPTSLRHQSVRFGFWLFAHLLPSWRPYRVCASFAQSLLFHSL